MVVPKLNPLRFYNYKANKLEDKLSFSEFCEYRNVKDNFKQSFQDYCENIYYKPFIFGEYGFTSPDDFTLFDADSFLYYSEAKLKGINEINVLNSNGAKIVVKAESDNVSLIVISGNTTGNIYYQQTKIFKKNEPIIIDGVNENVKITLYSAYTLTLFGYAICDLGDDYLINSETKTSDLIDISQYGAVYLMSTQEKVSYLPSPTISDEYSDVIIKYTIDLTPVYDNRENLKLEFGITTFGTITFDFQNNETFTNLPGDFKERIRQCYDWISFEDNGTYVTVEVAHYELTAVSQTAPGGTLTDYPVTYVSQRNDEFNWYLADGITEDFINLGTSYIQDIKGVIRAKNQTNFSLYRDYTPSIEVSKGAITKSFPIVTFPATAEIENGAHFSYGVENFEIVVISKKAYNRIYGTCNHMQIGNYKSEPFEILRLEESYAKKMQNVIYKNSYETKGMALDVFNGQLLLPCFIDYKGDAEYEIFNGQESSSVLGAQDLRSLSFKTFNAIPNYLTEMLAYIFIFDALKINEVSYAAIEPLSKEKQDDSYKYHIEQTLRENNYGYTI